MAVKGYVTLTKKVIAGLSTCVVNGFSLFKFKASIRFKNCCTLLFARKENTFIKYLFKKYDMRKFSLGMSNISIRYFISEKKTF